MRNTKRKETNKKRRNDKHRKLQKIKSFHRRYYLVRYKLIIRNTEQKNYSAQAVHVKHGLQGEDREDNTERKQRRKSCEALSIKITLKSVNILKQRHEAELKPEAGVLVRKLRQLTPLS